MSSTKNSSTGKTRPKKEVNERIDKLRSESRVTGNGDRLDGEGLEIVFEDLHLKSCGHENEFERGFL
jgi:hypothetical protein